MKHDHVEHLADCNQDPPDPDPRVIFAVRANHESPMAKRMKAGGNGTGVIDVTVPNMSAPGPVSL
jgi:hypothetical protein